jgi:hypothetical protein
MITVIATRNSKNLNLHGMSIAMLNEREILSSVDRLEFT